MFVQKSYFYLKRVQNCFGQNDVFFVRATPLKNVNFWEKTFIHIFCLI